MPEGIVPTGSAPVEPKPVETVAEGSKVATEGAAKAAPSKPASSGYSSDTTINSLKELREKAPEVYRAMAEGLVTNIIRKDQRSQDRLKKLWREGRDRE